MADLQAWIDAHTREVTIPSGLTVKIKPSTLHELALQGLIPLTLVDTYDTAKDEIINTDKLSDVVEKMGPIMAMYEAVFMVTMISPKLGKVADVANNTITFDMLSFEDRNFLFTEATRGFGALEKFREEQESNIDTA